jgi:peptidyl-prolyl cis-trans isomerase A (cyclophilin A)
VRDGGPGIVADLQAGDTIHDMPMRSSAAAVSLCLATIAASASFAAPRQTANPKLKDPASLTEQAPATYLSRFETNQGVFVIEAHREWAPNAADRFYNLVKNGFYDNARFFRVLGGFMAQFGLNGDPGIQRPWTFAGLPDEPTKQSNTRGFVSFARESSPNSRYTMVFINYKDNSYLDSEGFPPFGQVVVGMEIAEKLYSGYGRNNVPDQRRIISEGNAYLAAEYPKLDFIRRARIATTPAAR